MNHSETYYHGTGFTITLDNLTLTTTGRVTGGVAGRTSSANNGTGLYVTRDLWSDGATHYDENDHIFKQGTRGRHSAEKYAYKWHKRTDSQGNFTGGHPIYIYEIKLKSDFNSLDEYDRSGELEKAVPNIDVRNINKEQIQQLIAAGIDGIDMKNEQVILNKDKIQSFNLAYKATKYSTDHFHHAIWEKV
jgi:hypothetical protein